MEDVLLHRRRKCSLGREYNEGNPGAIRDTYCGRRGQHRDQVQLLQSGLLISGNNRVRVQSTRDGGRAARHVAFQHGRAPRRGLVHRPVRHRVRVFRTAALAAHKTRMQNGREAAAGECQEQRRERRHQSRMSMKGNQRNLRRMTARIISFFAINHKMRQIVKIAP